MKTVEEKHNAVMTELNRLLSEQKIGDLPSWPSYPQLKDTEELFALQIGDIGLPRIVSKVSPREFTKFHERIFDDFYRLLGLSERDAVASIEKRLETALRDIRKECDFSGKLTEENTELEAKNAALVAALDGIKAEFKRLKDGAKTLYDTVYLEGVLAVIEAKSGEALAANEKGGVQG